MMRILRSLLLLFAALGIVPAGAQESETGDTTGLPGEDLEIRAVEEFYLSAAKSVRNELSEQYLEALTKLEKELTGQNLLEDAVAVRREIEQVRSYLEDPESDDIIELNRFRPALPTLTFPLVESTRSRSVRLGPGGKSLIGFSREGASAKWDLPLNAPEGTYEVILEVSVASGEGGGFSVTIDDEQVVSQTVAGAGEWGESRSVYVGDVESGGQSKEISISISGVSQAEVFRLHGLILAPVGTWEAKQVEKVAETVEATPNLPPFTKYTGVRLISDPSNDGDSAYFLVDGKRWRFRTFFVRTPLDAKDKLTAGDKDALRAVSAAAKYFGVKASEASTMGIVAKDFTRQMLGGKDLTVYARVKEGSTNMGTVSKPIPAFIVADGKLLSEQLVVKGLGMLKGFPTDLPDGTDAKTYYKRLKEKEKKAQEDGVGGWGSQ